MKERSPSRSVKRRSLGENPTRLKEAASKLSTANAKARVRDLLRTNGFSIGKILAVQESIQKIVPAAQREPDHLRVIIKEMGEHLTETEPTFKDWAKEGDMSLDSVNWMKAKEELADVLILCARAIIMHPEYNENRVQEFMRYDLTDAQDYLMSSDATPGQLLAAALWALANNENDFRTITSSLYYIAQYAALMPFGITGLIEGWEYKVPKVVNRVYGTVR